MEGIKKAYFIGIGGIGMSALAQYMADQGAAVSGSDREASPITELLEKKGINVALFQKSGNVPADADMIVYSEAVWEDNPERIRAKELDIEQISYFDMLGKVSMGKKTVAVSGTHGKTTTTGMAAKILSDAGASPTAVVGSLVKDFGSNYLKGESDLFVVEACEYKRDFLSLSPFVLVVTNIEWDHTDYYKDLADLQSAFRELMGKVPAEGVIVTNAKHPNIAPLLSELKARIVDYTEEAAYELRLPGGFNKDNARAAAAAARVAAQGITSDSIATSLAHFHGTWRRFEYKGKTKTGADLYDDYAHHPTAIKATLAELRKKTKGKIIVAFHPHLYSRTRDLLPEFATAFKDANEVIVAPIYAAREIDEGTVSNYSLAQHIKEQGVDARGLDSFDEIEKALTLWGGEGDVIMTMGAGDIYKVADRLVRT